MNELRIDLLRSRALWFDDGTPVRAASAVAPFGDGWLVAQDDATHAAWCRPAGISRVRLFPPVQGLDTFSPADGTKVHKPDVEAAVAVATPDGPAVLALGSGSSPRRTRAALVGPDRRRRVAELAALYTAIGRRLGIDPAEVNLEGACVVGDALRWFNRGNLAAGVPSASIELDLAALLACFDGAAQVGDVVGSLGAVCRYELGAVDGVGLTVTDAVSLPDGRVLVSAAAEDTPNAIDDGPVVAAVLALLDGATVVVAAPLPLVDGRVQKVEGLAVVGTDADGALSVLAVVDDDDPDVPSAEHMLAVRLP